jgi:hypothetical protein
MKPVRWIRTLRTQTSERFLALADGADAAAIDLHFLPTGTVAGTVILLDSLTWTEDDIAALLKSFDEDFLPDVDHAQGTLNFTVVRGQALANYEGISSET